MLFKRKLKWGEQMLSIFDVACYILEKRLPNMTHKKLQKLCYYVQAWALAVRGERMMDCEFEAWVHGPVCRELYHQCKFDVNSILRMTEIQIIEDDDAALIDVVLDMYGHLTGAQLEQSTHAELPWREARNGLHYWELSSNIIDDDLMATYYLNELEEAIKE